MFIKGTLLTFIIHSYSVLAGPNVCTHTWQANPPAYQKNSNSGVDDTIFDTPVRTFLIERKYRSSWIFFIQHIIRHLRSSIQNSYHSSCVFLHRCLSLVGMSHWDRCMSCLKSSKIFAAGHNLEAALRVAEDWKNFHENYGSYEVCCHFKAAWNCEGLKIWYRIVTPPKTNMEPENGPLEKEIPIGNHHFQVPC